LITPWGSNRLRNSSAPFVSTEAPTRSSAGPLDGRHVRTHFRTQLGTQCRAGWSQDKSRICGWKTPKVSKCRQDNGTATEMEAGCIGFGGGDKASDAAEGMHKGMDVKVKPTNVPARNVAAILQACGPRRWSTAVVTTYLRRSPPIANTRGSPGGQPVYSVRTYVE
jgi:hypothetical protein